MSPASHCQSMAARRRSAHSKQRYRRRPVRVCLKGALRSPRDSRGSSSLVRCRVRWVRSRCRPHSGVGCKEGCALCRIFKFSHWRIGINYFPKLYNDLGLLQRIIDVYALQENSMTLRRKVWCLMMNPFIRSSSSLAVPRANAQLDREATDPVAAFHVAGVR